MIRDKVNLKALSLAILIMAVLLVSGCTKLSPPDNKQTNERPYEFRVNGEYIICAEWREPFCGVTLYDCVYESPLGKAIPPRDYFCATNVEYFGKNSSVGGNP